MARSALWRVDRSPSNTAEGLQAPLGVAGARRDKKRHSLAPVGVRPVYPGPHAITIQVNDVEFGAVTFEVAPGAA